jgi:universal stress protein F
MFKSIVVAIDLAHAERGKQLLAKARELLDKGGTIHLVHVMEHVPSFVAAELPSGLHDKFRSEADESLKAIASAAGSGVKTILREGSAATEILEAARGAGADLLMVASHRPDMRDYFLGSTAARVVRHSPCSVLVVR